MDFALPADIDFALPLEMAPLAAVAVRPGDLVRTEHGYLGLFTDNWRPALPGPARLAGQHGPARGPVCGRVAARTASPVRPSPQGDSQSTADRERLSAISPYRVSYVGVIRCPAGCEPWSTGSLRDWFRMRCGTS